MLDPLRLVVDDFGFEFFAVRGGGAKGCGRLGPTSHRELRALGAKASPESDAALKELISTNSETAAYQIAEAYGYRNDKNKAFEWLERARLPYNDHHGIPN